MRVELLKINNELVVRDKLEREEIESIFNPPQASNMGGHYERQIRSIRKVLYGLANKQTLTKEGLQTGMVKAAWIMNSRPLTTTSSEDPTVVAITPNHLMGIRTVETDTTPSPEDASTGVDGNAPTTLRSKCGKGFTPST